MRAGRTAKAVLGVIAMALAAPALAGDNGVFADRIVFGQAACSRVRPLPSGSACGRACLPRSAR
jgi:hypothetical protein